MTIRTPRKSGGVQRRAYLATVGTALLAGCTGSDDESTDESGQQTTDPASEETPPAETNARTPTDATGGTATTDGTATAPQTDTDHTNTKTQTPTDTATDSPTPTPASAEAVTLAEQSFEVHEEMFTSHGLRGMVEHTGDSQLRYVQLDASFYDDEETLLESSMTNIGWLAPGDTWEAWLGYPGDGADDDVETGELEITDVSAGLFEAPDAAELGDHAIEEGEFDVAVVGQVEHTGDETMDYLEAYVKFYNDDGNVISTSMDNITNIDAGETWQFDVPYASTDPTAPDVPPDYDVTLSV